MDTLAWILQILLALFLLLHGVMAIVKPPPARKQLEHLPYSGGFITFIGMCEILGAFGLVLPLWTGILPWLTPLAAIGLAIILAGAVFTHFHLKQMRETAGTGAILLLLIVVILFRSLLFNPVV